MSSILLFSVGGGIYKIRKPCGDHGQAELRGPRGKARDLGRISPNTEEISVPYCMLLCFKVLQPSRTNMSWERVDGKGPRWVGDNLPNLPKELQYAQDLPSKVTDTHVFFFGYDRPEPECCLQQWFPSPFSADGKQFHTTEQFMMYHKALLMGDTEVAEKIAGTDTPAKAKQLGREVGYFQQQIWNDNCDRVVEEGNHAKFKQNEELRAVLLGTGQRALVETSPNDRLWGIGFNSEEAEGNEEKWGQNKLGKALERVRERLLKDVS